MAFGKTGFRTEIGVGGASAAGRRRIVGDLRRWVRPECALAVGVAASLAFEPVTALQHGGLMQLGIALALLAALCGLVRVVRGVSTSAWLPALELTAGSLALMALLARHPEAHLSAFRATHSHFIGVPSELAYVALAGAALAIRASPASRSAWWLFLHTSSIGSHNGAA